MYHKMNAVDSNNALSQEVERLVMASGVPTWHKLESSGKGETSIEKIPPLDWPVGKAVVNLLD